MTQTLDQLIQETKDKLTAKGVKWISVEKELEVYMREVSGVAENDMKIACLIHWTSPRLTRSSIY